MGTSLERQAPRSTEPDRVRANTDPAVNERIDLEIEERVLQYSTRGRADISRRIDELDHEWDMERFLEANASTLAFTGVALAALHDRRWLILPGIVLPMLFQHAVQGWCPPVALFRRLGVRTKGEIDREKYALKALRGDFEPVPPRGDPARPSAVVLAAEA